MNNSKMFFGDVRKRNNCFSNEIRLILDQLCQIEARRFSNIRPEEFPENMFKILATGRAKIGKSTFLNRLIGHFCGRDAIFANPTDPISCTICLWKVRYGETPRISFYTKEDSEKKLIKSFDLKKSPKERRKVIRKLSAILRCRDNKFKKAGYLCDKLVYDCVLELDYEGLRNIEICDTPGRGEFPYLDELIDSEYEKADMIIYISQSFFSEGLPQVDLDNIVGIKTFMESKFKKSFFDRAVFVGNYVDYFLGDTPSQVNMYKDESGEEEEGEGEGVILEELKLKPEKSAEEKILDSRNYFRNKLGEKFHHSLSLSQVQFCSSVSMGYFKFGDLYKKLFKNLVDTIVNRINHIKFEVTAKETIFEILRKICEYFEDIGRIGVEESTKVEAELKQIEKQSINGLEALRKRAKERENSVIEGMCSIPNSEEIYQRVKNSVCSGEIDLKSFNFWYRESKAKSILRSRFIDSVTFEIRKVLMKEWTEFMVDVIKFHNKYDLSKIVGSLRSIINTGYFVNGNDEKFGKIIHSFQVEGLTNFDLFRSTIKEFTNIFFANNSYDLKWREQSFDDLWKEYCEIHKSSALQTGELFFKEMFDKLSVFENYIIQRMEEMKLMKNQTIVSKKEIMRSRSASVLDCEVKLCSTEYNYLYAHRIVYFENKMLGSGKSGNVIIGEIDGTEVAVKRLEVDEEFEKSSKLYILNEIHIMNTVRIQGNLLDNNNHMMPLICCRRLENSEKYEIVMEKYDLDLGKVLIFHPEKLGDPEIRKSLIFQVCEAVKFMHDRSIIYRDLKPMNCLMNEDASKLVVCDYGIAKPEVLMQFTIAGTGYFMDRGVSLNLIRTYGKEVDIYSLGIVMAEIWEKQVDVLKIPIYQKSAKEYKMIVESRTPILAPLKNKEGLTEDQFRRFQELLHSCTVLGKERPTIRNVINSLMDEIFTDKRKRKRVIIMEEDNEFEKPTKKRKIN